MDLTKKEAEKLKVLTNRLKSAEDAVKQLEIDRKEALADVFEAEDNGRDVTKLRKTAKVFKDRLEEARQKISHCDGRLKDGISKIVVKRAAGAEAELAKLSKIEVDLMRECGQGLARVVHILTALGADFSGQRQKIERLWIDHFQAETVSQGDIIRKAHAETKSDDIRDISAERHVLKNLKSSPENVKLHLYSSAIRGSF